MNDLITQYQAVANIPDSLTEQQLVDYLPTPTEEDIKRGFMTRYFVRQVNHTTGYITEIDPTEFDSLRMNKFYKTVQLTWRITGSLDDVAGPNNVNSPTRLFTGVKTANQLALAAADKELPGLQFRIRNLTQFYQFGK